MFLCSEVKRYYSALSSGIVTNHGFVASNSAPLKVTIPVDCAIRVSIASASSSSASTTVESSATVYKADGTKIHTCYFVGHRYSSNNSMPKGCATCIVSVPAGSYISCTNVSELYVETV